MANDTVEDLHVAIVGAGIGGLALAIALHKKGVSFRLYEEATQYSAVGAGIGFGPNGLQAMDLVEPDFRQKYETVCVGNKSSDAQHVFFEGLLLEDGLGLGESWHGHSSWGHAEYTRKSAHRKSLLDIMTSFIPNDRVEFGKRLTGIEEHPEKVTVTFADGDIVEASILVGADGIKSAVREHVLGFSFPDEVMPVYAASYCYRGVIPIAEAEEILGDLTDVAKFYFGNNRSCVTYRISGGAEFNFLLCVADNDHAWPSHNTVTERVSHETMMADFSNRSVDNRFLQLLAKADAIRWGFFHHKHTSTYHRDRTVLLGDSAHASLPFQAAGAAQALEDALILSNLLGRIASTHNKTAPPRTCVHGALRAYDTVRRPRAQKQVEQSAEVALMIHFQHPEAGSDMSKILPMLQQGRFDWLWFHDLRVDIESALRKIDEALKA